MKLVVKEVAMTFYNKQYLVDTSAVKGFGLNKWADNFFMPVLRSTYLNIYHEISISYGKSLNSLNPSAESYWSWAVNYKITYQLAEYLYGILFLKKLREEGFESIFISSEMKLSDAEKKLFDLLSFPVISTKLDMPHLLIEKWRAIRTNWGRCSFSSCLLPSIFNSKLYILGGRDSEEVGAYLKDLSTESVNLRPDLYTRKNFSANFMPETERACRIFKDQMSGMLKKYGLTLPEEYWQDLATHTDKCAQMISGTKKNICGWAKSELIINPVANLKHRIFASAWRLSGGSVTGTTHGNLFALGNVPGDMINGSNIILNRFVAMSSEEKKLFESARENYKTGLESHAEVYPCRNTIYHKMSKRLRKGVPATSIKKVMLIGSPLNNALPMSDRLCYLFMEIELVSLLIKNNYHIIYKAHPDTLKATEQLFAETGCKRVTDKFEDVWDTCDCVLFPHVFTTAFGLSLMTPKHIIALNWKDNSFWRPESLEKLKTRATILDIYIDGEGKPFFDKKMLLDSLASPKGFDHSLIDEFALM